MANVDKPRGFRPYGYRYPVMYFPAAASQTWKRGDMLTLSGSTVVIATSSSSKLLGVAADDRSGTTAGDLVPVYAHPMQQFVGQCSGNPGPETSIPGTECDIEGTTGIMEINEDAKNKKVVKLLKLKEGSTGNEANAEVVFVINQHHLAESTFVLPTIGDMQVLCDTVALDDDGTVDLPNATAGFVVVSCGAEGGVAAITTAGAVTILAGSANFVNTDTDEKLCLYDGGTKAVLKNRLGAAKEANYAYFYHS